MTLRTIHFDTLLSLCQQTSDVVIALDTDGHISFLNDAAEATFDLQTDAVSGAAPADVPALASLLPFIERAHSDYSATRERVTLPDGGIIWVQIVQTQPNTASANGDDQPRITNMMGEIVHDMKRPLASAKSYIDLIEASGTLSNKQTTFAKKARRRLLAMINQFHQLEDMAWLDSNGDLHKTDVNVLDVIKRALKHLEGLVQQQPITIAIEVDENPCPLQADAHRLESVFGNLLHNAIKYSPDGGDIRITARKEDNRAIFEVHDQGIGIAADYIPRLFDQFYRVHDTTTAQIEGSGMGLSIVRTIVEKHGGQVFVTSTLGKGSTFGFWLPCDTR